VRALLTSLAEVPVAIEAEVLACLLIERSVFSLAVVEPLLAPRLKRSFIRLRLLAARPRGLRRLIAQPATD
jgi:hypothetical protein